MTDGQVLRVMCPYCRVGSAYVDVLKFAGASQLDKKPRQCDGCRRYFDLKIEMKVSGVPLERVDRASAVRNALKGLVEHGS